MDIKALETLISVADLGSMAETARRQGLTPAAIAQRIGALEQELGLKLVTRAGRRMRPTPEGVIVAERSRSIVQEAAMLAAIDIDEVYSGPLRIGAIATALTGILPHPIKELSRLAPRLAVHISARTSAQLYEDIQNREIDVAVLVKPPFAFPKTYGWHSLRKEPLILLKPESLRGTDPVAILKTHPYIVHDRNSWGGRLTERYLREQKIQLRGVLELDSLDAISLMVHAGLGVTIVPEWASPWPGGMKINRLRLPHAPLREVGLLWIRSGIAPGRIELLKQAFR